MYKYVATLPISTFHNMLNSCYQNNKCDLVFNYGFYTNE